MLIKPVFLTIHGIDGVGKSSITTALCDILNNEQIPTINYGTSSQKWDNPFSKIKKIVKETATPQQEFLNFINSHISHSHKIKELLQQNTSVVKDRFSDDIGASSSFRGVQYANELIQFFEKSGDLLVPDHKILLTANENVRMKRIEKREWNNEMDYIPNKPGHRAYHFEQYLKKRIQEHGTKGLELDTSDMDIKEVSYRIYDFIKAQ